MPDVLDIPLLTGPTLTLRPHTAADVDAVLERCRHPDTIRWTTVPDPYTREMAQEYVARLGPSAEQVSWAIERGGTYAGTIDLRSWGCDADHGSGNLGFVTHQHFRGRGVMSEAIALVLDHAFGELGWEHVTWQANVGNYASAKAAWRAGFPPPVLVPALLLHRGRMVDGWHSAIEAGSPRQPSLAWPRVYAVLQQQARAARRPG